MLKDINFLFDDSKIQLEKSKHFHGTEFQEKSKSLHTFYD